MAKILAGAASRFAQREYGGLFGPVETEVAVGIAAVIAAEQDPDAISLLITNTGTTIITLSTRVGVVSGVGVLLLGNGATLTLNVREDGDTVGMRWNAISALAGGSLHVVKTTLVGILSEEEE